MKRIGFIACFLLYCLGANAEVIPPAPKQYFSDYANVVPAATASRLNRNLADFERTTSSQVVVAVFPKMQSESSIEDYTVRVAEAWKVGQKGKNNGAVLFVFVQDRKLFIQVGYGLEGALPDALCKRIIEDEIKPHFRKGDYDAGLSAGVTAILAATKGEYKGSGRTLAERRLTSENLQTVLPFLVFAVLLGTFIVMSWKIRSRGGYWHGWTISSSGFSSGGWSGGNGGFSSGGGGFSGGGGSFGGGGAGGSW